MNANHRAIKEGIRRELETARAKFHTLLADLSFQTGDYLYCQFSK